jgi:hypothetical protein
VALVIYNVANKTNINWATADIRVLLFGGTSVPAGCLDPDLTNVAAILAVSGAAELTATNYARKATTRTDTQDDVNNRANQALSVSVLWENLGGTINGTIRGYLFYVYNAADASAIPILAESFAVGVLTDGTDVILPAQDVIRTAQGA